MMSWAKVILVSLYLAKAALLIVGVSFSFWEPDCVWTRKLSSESEEESSMEEVYLCRAHLAWLPSVGMFSSCRWSSVDSESFERWCEFMLVDEAGRGAALWWADSRVASIFSSISERFGFRGRWSDEGFGKFPGRLAWDRFWKAEYRWLPPWLSFSIVSRSLLPASPRNWFRRS